MIKAPQIFFLKFYSRRKLTCAKTFCFKITTMERICNTQFYGLVTTTRAQFEKFPTKKTIFLWKKNSPIHESPFNFKTGRRKVKNLKN